MSSNQVEAVLTHLDQTQDDARARLFDLLRIPSISAQPDHAADCAQAARWLAHEFAAIGFTTEIRETPGHPIVIGHYPGPEGAANGALPHVLFYGHYDVQPADPLELWTSQPFEPQLVDHPDGVRVVARGAVDDKGQVVAFLCACRAWYLATGSLPVRITLLLEGEEEVGSPNLDGFIAANRAALSADVALISDTGMWDRTTPAITSQLRGMVYVQIDLFGPSRDLHSGMYGGSALNPINALTRILGELHDDQGRVRIPGFYDGVPELPPALAAQWDALGFDETAMLEAVGLSTPSGELGQDLNASPGVAVPLDGPFIAAAVAALTEEYGKPPVMMGCGGSIPVVGSLRSLLGLDTILMGFGLEDDQVHSPNEKFDWACFEGGARSHARLLGKLGGLD
jgi:acetylornithine deacetylase/succinyl-diaminopimelate desuccinylase-like protein